MKRTTDYFPAFVRISVGADAIVSWYNSIAYPLSPMFRIASHQDGGIVIWVMGIIGTILILDALINDCTPDRITIRNTTFVMRWKHVFKGRHFVIMTLALCYAIHPYLAERSGYELFSTLFFNKHAIFTAGLAIFDVKDRSRGMEWQRAYS